MTNGQRAAGEVVFTFFTARCLSAAQPDMKSLIQNLSPAHAGMKRLCLHLTLRLGEMPLVSAPHD
jgi:hypothetical protein